MGEESVETPCTAYANLSMNHETYRNALKRLVKRDLLALLCTVTTFSASVARGACKFLASECVTAIGDGNENGRAGGERSLLGR